MDLSLLKPLRYLSYFRVAKSFIFRPTLGHPQNVWLDSQQEYSTVFFYFHEGKRRNDFDQAVSLVYSSLHVSKIKVSALYKFDFVAFLMFLSLSPFYFIRKDRFLLVFVRRRIAYLNRIIIAFGRPKNVFTFCDAMVDDFYVAYIYREMESKRSPSSMGFINLLKPKSLDPRILRSRDSSAT